MHIGIQLITVPVGKTKLLESKRTETVKVRKLTGRCKGKEKGACEEELT
jgi:hypothetical protein